MKVYMALTDRDWIAQLSEQPVLDQVNFWLPGEVQGFAALHHGELFLFKTKATDGNQIVGAGIFDAYARASVEDAWDWFALGNGVTSLAQFLQRVGHYRRSNELVPSTTQIGCVMLSFVSFFAPHERLPAPDDWSLSIQRGKAYETDVLPATHPVRLAVAQYLGVATELADTLPGFYQEKVFGDPQMRVARHGQHAFEAVIARNYRNRCAITGDKVRPVLQAAHILPVAKGGIHRSDNGMLLRSDIHTLFDRGYLAVDTKHRLLVSPRLRDEFGNGDALYAKVGETIALPDRRGDRPGAEFLEWHLDTVFKA